VVLVLELVPELRSIKLRLRRILKAVTRAFSSKVQGVRIPDMMTPQSAVRSKKMEEKRR
jgi:hypothetical protein